MFCFTKIEKVQTLLALVRSKRNEAMLEHIQSAGEAAGAQASYDILKKEDADSFAFFNGNTHYGNKLKFARERSEKSLQESQKWAGIEEFIVDEFLNHLKDDA